MTPSLPPPPPPHPLTPSPLTPIHFDWSNPLLIVQSVSSYPHMRASIAVYYITPVDPSSTVNSWTARKTINSRAVQLTTVCQYTVLFSPQRSHYITITSHLQPLRAMWHAVLIQYCSLAVLQWTCGHMTVGCASHQTGDQRHLDWYCFGDQDR